MNQGLKNILELNLALLIIATSAVLGNYISLPPEISIWSRCFFGVIAITIYCKIKGISLKYDYKKDTTSFVFCAVLQGVHWITYFYALQMAGAGLGVISLFTFPIVTTLLEPVLLKTKFNPKHILLGLLVLLGLYILTPEFNFGNQTTLGIIFGVSSSVFFATRNILMKKHVATYDASMLMFHQTGWISLLMIPVLFFIDFTWVQYQSQISELVFLGMVSTAVGHTLYVKTFKYFSATTASLLSCIQPLYVVILAFIFLGEIPTISTAIGGTIILSAVILETFISKKA